MLVPKLRFKREDGTDYPEWEEKRLSDLLTISKERNNKAEYTQNDVLACSLGTELGKKYLYFGLKATKESVKNYRVVRIGDIVYTKSPIKGFPNGIIRANKRTEGIVPSLYCVYHNESEVRSDIIQTYFDTGNNVNNFLNKLVNVGARNNVNITDIGLLEGTIIVPVNSEEQQKIADFLSTVDEVIAQSESEVANLEQQKKAAMQKIFSQEVRFKREDGTDYPEWEVDSLKNLCDYTDYRGKTPTKTDSGIFLITAKNIKQGYIDYETSKEYIAESDYDNVMHRGLPQLGDVLITTEAPCGNIAQIDKENVALAQRVIKYRGKKDILSNDYLCFALQSDFFQDELDKKATGGTVKGIKGSVLHTLSIFAPCLEEQQKIADFLSAYDEAIRYAKQELDKWKELKKGLLQQMFV